MFLNKMFRFLGIDNIGIKLTIFILLFLPLEYHRGKQYFLKAEQISCYIFCLKP